MIAEQTVFILGAGASWPYMYPTGQELSDDISVRFAGDYERHVRKATHLDNPKKVALNKEAKEFADIFKKTGESIDLFLSINPDFSDIGKKAIALMILKAEKESLFRVDMLSEFRKQDWYTLLFKKMRKGLFTQDSYKRFAENRVSFINFNYDRSLEHFLYESLINLYHSQKLEEKLDLNGLSLDEQKKLIPFPFLHVYGKIAEVEWLDGLEYGKDLDYQRINEVKDNIEVIYYDREQKDFSEIHKTIRNAKRIFFLGFGFAPENMKLLGMPEVLRHGPNIFGTALGWIKKDIDGLIASLKYGFRMIEPENCYELLRKHL